MTIFNKGRRSYDIDVNTKKDKPADMKHLEPQRTLEVPDAIGEKLVKKYHRDLVDHANMSAEKKSKLEKIVEAQRAENKKLAQRVIDLEKEVDELKKAAKPAKG